MLKSRLLVAGLIMLAAACSSGDDEDPAPTGTVSYLVIEPDSLTLAIGETGQLTAQAFDSADKVIPGAMVRWMSVYPEVAVDSITGRVKALGHQRAFIEARSGNALQYVLVKVPGELAQVALNPAVDTVLPGHTVQFAARFFDAFQNPLAPTPLSWSVTNGTLGAVSSTGLFMAAWPGIAHVTATATGGIMGGADTRVLVPVASVQLDPSALSLAPGTSFRATATLRDSAGGTIPGRRVTWSATPGTTATAAHENSGLQLALLCPTMPSRLPVSMLAPITYAP